ncbi:MAG: CpaF family protein, partial [Ferrovum sp.]|nr:CpaF family protein [Ferrovum sp.]
SSHLESMLYDALGALGGLLADDSVREIMVNGPNQVWVEQRGCLLPLGLKFSAQDGFNVIHVVAALAARDAGFSSASRVLDAAFSHWRISAVLPPVAVLGPALCIRKHGAEIFPLRRFSVPDGGLPTPETFCSEEVFREDELLDRLISWLVKGRNLLVSGGTGTGKTALLNALIAQIPKDQRLVVIEDTHEIKLDCPNHVIFEAIPSAGVTLRDLVRQALRFRPDRIIVGEVRGPEAFDLLQAMNTGHSGCLGTLHANSSEDALQRMVQLVLQAGMGWSEEAIARQVGRSVQGVVHLARVRGVRFIQQLQQVEGYDNGRYQLS